MFKAFEHDIAVQLKQKPFYIANGPDNGASVCGQFAGGGAGGHDPRPATSLGGVGGGANVPGPQGNGSAGTTNTGGGGSGGGGGAGNSRGSGGSGNSGSFTNDDTFSL